MHDVAAKHKPPLRAQIREPDFPHNPTKLCTLPSDRLGVSPQTHVMRLAVLSALEQGPATAKQIESRMGFLIPQRGGQTFLLEMERAGAICRIGFQRGREGRSPIIYSLPPKGESQ